jgi:hypothetical protein
MSWKITRHHGLSLMALLAALAAPFVLHAAGFHLPFGDVRRVQQQPALAPQGSGWESAGVFNPAVVRRGKEFVMLYRAQDRNGTSRLGYATSSDGMHFTRRSEPALVPKPITSATAASKIHAW